MKESDYRRLAESDENGVPFKFRASRKRDKTKHVKEARTRARLHLIQERHRELASVRPRNASD